MKNALIFHGGWNGHQPAQFADWAERHLEDDGFSVERSDSLDVLTDEDLTRFDLIVPVWTMGILTPEGERALLDAVRNGTGLAGWHGGMGDAFRNSPAYQFMVGGQFVAHPGDIRRYRVDIGAVADPITADLASFEIESEQYYLHVDPCNRVLATTTFDAPDHPWIRGCTMPVVWTRSWGDGRVFYCSLGHTVDEFEVPEVARIVCRGLAWACRGATETKHA